jgi:heme A synthase
LTRCLLPAGFVVALPAAYFAARGMVNAPLGRRLSLLFLMGGMQGLVGWWMVRSGFRVSALRLAGRVASRVVSRVFGGRAPIQQHAL